MVPPLAPNIQPTRKVGSYSTELPQLRLLREVFGSWKEDGPSVVALETRKSEKGVFCAGTFPQKPNQVPQCAALVR